MGVTRANTAKSPDNRTAGERKIPKRVEQLVANELVGVA